MKKYQMKNQKGIFCSLCPHHCYLKKNDRGKCYARQNIDNNIELVQSFQYSHVAAEPIEKKPFVKYLKGSKTLSIGGLGCNFTCKYCENSSISQECKIKTTKLSINKIIEYAKAYDCDSICFTYNEPIIYYEDILLLSIEAHKNNLKIILKTNAYINKEPWKDICRVVDAINIDIKGGKWEYKNICAVSNGHAIVKNRLLEACNRNIHIEVNIPIYNWYKNINYFYKTFAEFNYIIKKYDIPVHLINLHSGKENINTNININKIECIYKNKISHIDIVN
ncbi:MAG: radical SAM protein [archaeon]